MFLASRGKRTIGWDGYIAGKVPAAAIGMSSHAVKDDAAGNKYGVFSFQGNSPRIYDIGSRWHMQLGMRVTF